MKRAATYLLCTITLGAFATQTIAQESHDALALARAKATAQNQRVLLLLTGGETTLGSELTKAINNYATLGKLLRYEYQVAALPADSLAGKALRGQLGLGELALPTLAVLDTEDMVLSKMGAQQMLAEGRFSTKLVRSFLDQQHCEPLNAREVLADALAVATASKRHAFVYLSAPW